MFISRRVLQKSLRLVRTVAEAENFLLTLEKQGTSIIALDCEGVRLGRFGRLSLMQIAEPCGTFTLIDGVSEDTVKAMKPLLESGSTLKVMHDCREDSAALFHQFGGIRLSNVVDTQVANLLVQREQKSPNMHQTAYTDLIEEYLGKTVRDSVNMKDQMVEDPFLWHRRPLTKELVDYAVEGVEYLLPLWEALSVKLNTYHVGLPEVLQASGNWLDYRELNPELTEPRMVERIGTPITGMVAAINSKGVFFKLNIGRTGVCSTPSALKRMLLGSGGFPPVQVGDSIELAVSGISLNGSTIYVDRRDPDWEFFDFLRRPSPKKKGSAVEEYRHVPSLVEAGGIDPLLRRGLGEDGGIDSDDEDQVDHEPVLTKKPPTKRRD